MLRERVDRPTDRATVAAKDDRGGEGFPSATTTTVSYPGFEGFAPPFANSPTANGMRAGRAVPLTFGLAALSALAVGLTKTVSFERTGQLLILVSCLVLLGVAGLASRAAPVGVAVIVAAPAVLCGGLTLLAGGTLLPQTAALPAFTLGLAGLVGLVATRSS